MDIRIYRYYRDLIRLRENGNPALLLKVLHPNESFLADPASRLYVRLRLGGIHFPPNVFYKVFTTMAVTDIGSFAPRDYTDPKSEKWYRRVENNGWRAISFIENAAREPDTLKEWHPSKIIRKQLVEKKKKEAKRKWLQHLYALGALEERGTPQSAAEEAELLAWSTNLNFEAYQQSWMFLATTRVHDNISNIDFGTIANNESVGAYKMDENASRISITRELYTAEKIFPREEGLIK